MDAPELVSPSAHQMPDIIPLAPSVATAEHPVATPPAPAPAAPTKSTLRARVQMSPQASAALSRARAGAGKAHEFVGSFGTRAAQLRRHPAAARVEAIAAEHTARAREVLGRSEALRSAEAATGIDRIPLVLGAAAL
jgi:hypothetical protein